MMNKLIFISILCIVCSFSAEIKEEGIEGSWSQPTQASKNYYMCGVQMRFKQKSFFSDQTATNGLKFVFCNLDNWNSQQQKKIEGNEGDWQQTTMCSQGFFINGFNARVQPYQFFNDNTALNGLKIKCMKPYTSKEQTKTVYEGIWGDWTGWKQAPLYELIDSYTIRYQENGFSDNTALNGLALYSKEFAKIVSTDFNYVIPQHYNLQPEAISTSNLHNNASTVLKQKVTFSNQKTFYQKWENEEQYLKDFKLLSNFKNKIPFLTGDTDVIYAKEQKKDITFGNETSYKVQSAQELQVTVKPCSHFIVRQMIKKVDLEIPYTLTLKFSNGHQQTVKGKYSGVLCSDIYSSISESNIQGCSVEIQDNEEISQIKQTDIQHSRESQILKLRVGNYN